MMTLERHWMKYIELKLIQVAAVASILVTVNNITFRDGCFQPPGESVKTALVFLEVISYFKIIFTKVLRLRLRSSHA